MTLPYSSATSGRSAFEEIRKILIGFGCSKLAPLEDFDAATLAIQFEYRGRLIQVTANAKGYAAAFLREKPYSSRMRKSRVEYERQALQQGQVACWSILRDWIKGQIMAIETGVLSFEGAFLGQILLPTGRSVLEEVETRGLLQIEGPKDE